MSRAAVGAARIEMSINSVAFKQQLERMDKATKKWRRSLRNVERQFLRVGRNMERTGRSITRNVTGPIVGLTTGLVALQKRTGDYADQLLDLSEITGLSTDALQEWRNVARIAGVETDAISNAVSGLSRRIRNLADDSGSAYEAAERLGINFKDSEGNIRDTDEVMAEAIQRLSQMEGGLERAGLANDLFGRRWEQIAPILGMTSSEIENARQQAHDLGMVMDGNALEAANRFRLQMSELREQIAAAGRNIAVDLMPVMQNELIPAFTGLAQNLVALIRNFTQLDEETQKNVLKYTALAAAIGPVIWASGKLVTSVGKLIGVFRTLSFTLIPLLAKIGAIVGVVTGLAILAKSVVDTWEPVGTFFARLWDQISDYFIGHINNIIDMFNWVRSQLARVVPGISDVVIDNFGAMTIGVRHELGRFGDNVRDNFNDALGYIQEFASGSMEWLEGVIDAITRVQRSGNEMSKTFEKLPMQSVKDYTDRRTRRRLKSRRFEQVSVNVATSGNAVESIASMEARMRSMGEALRHATNPEQIELLKDKMADLELQMEGTTQAGNFLSNVTTGWVNSFGDGMANLVVQGGKFVDILNNMKRLLASQAITSGISAILTGGLGGSGFFGRGGGLLGRVFGVNDALIRNDGTVIRFHPDDDILAMKDFGNLGAAIEPHSGQSSQFSAKNMKLSGEFRIKGTDLVLALEEANYTLR